MHYNDGVQVGLDHSTPVRRCHAINAPLGVGTSAQAES